MIAWIPSSLRAPHILKPQRTDEESASAIIFLVPEQQRRHRRSLSHASLDCRCSATYRMPEVRVTGVSPPVRVR